MGQKQVNVIGHYHEGMQLIPATRKQVGDYTLSNFWTSQPLWLIRGTIQQLIAPGETRPQLAPGFKAGSVPLNRQVTKTAAPGGCQ
jgi:hypothetical protein